MVQVFKKVQRVKMCDEIWSNESLVDQSLGGNYNISDDYEYRNIPRETEEE